jgi:predicted dehydrogenase
MRIGIVGAESSHTSVIARILNVDQAVPGATVTHVWGESDEFARKAAGDGEIPCIVRDPEEMIGRVDAVVVDHRDGKHHVTAAKPFLEAGLPVFVDKPFCTDLAEGLELVRFARARGAAITSFSTLPLEPSVREFADHLQEIGRVRALVTAGPCDIDGPYSGVFFYGVHQVEMVLSFVGARPVSVTATRSGADGVATVTFDSGAIASLHCLQDWWGGGGFHAFACGEEGTHSAHLTSEEKPFLTGVKLFCGMFETGVEPVPPQRYLTGVAVLAAMRESFAAGVPVTVQRVPEL